MYFLPFAIASFNSSTRYADLARRGSASSELSASTAIAVSKTCGAAVTYGPHPPAGDWPLRRMLRQLRRRLSAITSLESSSARIVADASSTFSGVSPLIHLSVWTIVKLSGCMPDAISDERADH